VVLVTTAGYNDQGEAYKTVDPADREDRTEFDDAGRVTRGIQNYTDGDPSTGGSDEDVTVETTYTADGQVATYTAKNPTTGDQVTTYVYGTATGGITPEIYRNDLLRAVIYPDSDDPADLSGNGADGTYDRVEYKYNRQGQRTWMKDQTDTVHEYTYDLLGRQTADKVTALGTGVDGTVRRIERSYELGGMVASVTSYDAVTAGNVVNEVELEYNEFGLPTKEYQEHEGQINDDSSGNPGAAVSEYTYLGLGTMVIEDFPEPDVKLDYWGGTSGTYAGFDRFGRVVEQRWVKYNGTPVDRDKYTYGYDRASNRNYRENTTTTGKDEYYTYDGMHRLKSFDRGDLNAGKTGISGTPVREEDFTLDPLGNWTAYIQETSGSTDLDQDRSHNNVNEITDITETTGPSWITPAYDRAGNMTTIPKPSSPADGLTCKYDAWNRLVEVKDGQTVVARYEYDGLGRRIKKQFDSHSPSGPNGIDTYVHYFYNNRWQVVETRDATTESDQPENLQPKYQHVWSPRYIDSLILRDENTDQDGLCDDERIYYLADANYNVTALVDTNGDVLERYIYSPYGEVTVLDADFSSDADGLSDYGNTTLYTGRELDPATGLYYYRARFYHAGLGTFVGRDPLESDMHLYRYCHNNPLGRTDPTGQRDWGPKPDCLSEAQWDRITRELDLTGRALVTLPNQRTTWVNSRVSPDTLRQMLCPPGAGNRPPILHQPFPRELEPYGPPEFVPPPRSDFDFRCMKDMFLDQLISDIDTVLDYLVPDAYEDGLVFCLRSNLGSDEHLCINAACDFDWSTAYAVVSDSRHIAFIVFTCAEWRRLQAPLIA